MLRGQEEFANGVLAAGLATAAEMREYRQAWPESQQETGAEALATLFVQNHWLTPFQANEILHERGTPLVLNDYVILDCLGRGGMGEVYKAQHRRMERIVALKLIAAHLTQDVAIKRFQREVKAAAKLSHPNIVATYDAGEFRGHHYLVMEFVDGEDLDRFADRNPLQPLQAVNLMAQAATGLEYAHACGVIHRDIKPSNLYVDKFGRLRILDMGIARIDQTLSDDGLTHTGMLMGTVDYMAPEQGYDIRNIDGRCDVYSLGCTLYRVLTGKVMYHGDTFLEKARRHERDPIPALREGCPAAPAELAAVFERMVAKLPKDRYPNMAALREALTALEQRLSAAPAAPGWFGSWGKPAPSRRTSTAAGAGMLTPPLATPPLPVQSSNSVALLPSAGPGTTPDEVNASLTPSGNSNSRPGTTESTARKQQTAVTHDRESDQTIPQLYELPRRRSWLGLAASAICVVGLITAYVVVSLPRDSLPMLSWRRGEEPADVPVTEPVVQSIEAQPTAPAPIESSNVPTSESANIPEATPPPMPAVTPKVVSNNVPPPAGAGDPPVDSTISRKPPILSGPSAELIKARAVAEAAMRRAERAYELMSPELLALLGNNSEVLAAYKGMRTTSQTAEEYVLRNPGLAATEFAMMENQANTVEHWILTASEALRMAANVEAEIESRVNIHLFARPFQLQESAMAQLNSGGDVDLAYRDAMYARQGLEECDATDALRKLASTARFQIAQFRQPSVSKNSTYLAATKKMDLADIKMAAGSYDDAKALYREVVPLFDSAKLEIAKAQQAEDDEAKKPAVASVAPKVALTKLTLARSAAEAAVSRTERLHGAMSAELKAIFAKNAGISGAYKNMLAQSRLAEQNSLSKPDEAAIFYAETKIQAQVVEAWIVTATDVLRTTNKVKAEIGVRAAIPRYALPNQLQESARQKLSAGTDAAPAFLESEKAWRALDAANAEPAR